MVEIAVTARSFAKSEALRAQLHDVARGHRVRFVDPDKILSEAELVEFIGDAEVLLVGREVISAPLLDRLPHLRFVAVYGVGTDNIDATALAARGIGFHWEGGVNAEPVAELTIGLMISLLRNIGLTSRLLSQGVWRKDGGQQFGGRTVGIVGCGHIGSRVARLVRAFNCKVLITDILDKADVAREVGGRQVALEELLSQSDVVTLHVPLTAETRHMIRRETLDLMKKSCVLVNTSRGAVVQLEALKEALREGRIAGAALDVFEVEPMVDKDLYSLENFVGTPHIAGNSVEAVAAMGAAAVRGIARYLSCGR